MTREEAITRLKNMAWLYGSAEREQNIEAVDMAISALSQPIVAKHFDIQSGYIYCSPEIAENVKVVVRCKDCDNTVPHWYMLNGKRVDCNWCVEMESEVDDDEYCSRAVPKGTRAKMKGGAE